MPILVKNGRVYSSTSSGSSGGANAVEMTQAQYNALQSPDPNIIYFITDGTAGYPSADDIEYDNTTSELTADNMQDAIDELNTKLTEKDEWTELVQATVTTTESTVTLTNGKFSDYKTIVFVGFNGTSRTSLSATMELPTSIFISLDNIRLNDYVMNEYRGGIAISYVNDTTITLRAFSLTG